MKNVSNIHPIFEKTISRQEKEVQLHQQAKVIWLTGLSGSGKSTIALGLEKRLAQEGFLTQLLDGDNIRTGISNNLGFSQEDRQENIRRISEISKLFLNCGIITINCFISPTNTIRNLAKKIIGTNDFIEVFVNTPLQICEQRDTKGLYKKARAGEIKHFTGIDSPFEKPTNPTIELNTENQTIKESVDVVFQTIIHQIKKTEC